MAVSCLLQNVASVTVEADALELCACRLASGQSAFSERRAHHTAGCRFSDLPKCVACQDLPARPEVRYSTLVKHEEEVTVFYEPEPMRDHDDCHSSTKLSEGLSNQTLRSTIEGTCGLIQNEHPRSTREGTSDRQSLSLTPGQSGTAFSDSRRVEIWHPHHILVKMSRPRRSLNLLGRHTSKEWNIKCNRCLQQNGVLGDKRHGTDSTSLRDPLGIHVPNQCNAIRRLEHSEKNLTKRRLSTSRPPCYTQNCPVRDRK